MPPTSSADRPFSGHDLPGLHARLAPVLAGLRFPARRWQAVAESDLYGCDSVTRALVDRLPERTYGSLGELVAVLGAVLAGRVVPAPTPTGRQVVPPAHARRSGITPVPGVPGAGTSATAPGSLGARQRSRRAPGSPSPAA